MKYLRALTSRTCLIPLALIAGGLVGAAVVKSQTIGWSNARWSMEAYEAANTAALLDQNKPDRARDLARRQMAVALDSFAANANEADVQENAGLLKAISTYLAAKPGIEVLPATQQLLKRFPPLTRSQAQHVKCSAAICEFAKENATEAR